MTEYRVRYGTSWHTTTPDEVIAVLETARQNHTRLHISFGDAETGKDWLEECLSYGYIGRSTGTNKIPLLVHNRSSMGGGALLDHCIVRIRTSKGGTVLYKHPNYHSGDITIHQKETPVELGDGRKLTIEVRRDGEVQAAFETLEQAQRYCKKLGILPSSESMQQIGLLYPVGCNITLGENK